MQTTHLMLVTFLTADLATLAPGTLNEFEKSPYNALAVPVISSYFTGSIPTLQNIQPKLAEIKARTSKDIWPWVFINRMVGMDPGQKNVNAHTSYFQGIKGLDLEDRVGAQSDFLRAWRVALEVARELHAPGIVCDLELYNNPAAEDVFELARLTGKTAPEAIQLLQGLGTRLADITDEELPGGTVWFFFTGLHRPDFQVVDDRPYYRATSYVVLGMLMRIKQAGLRVSVISGGEIGLGYCHASIKQLQSDFEARLRAFRPHLEKYAGILFLGGTITLWRDASDKSDWLAQGSCAASPARNIEELKPYLRDLLRHYTYVWVYAAVAAGGYNPFDPLTAPRFNAVIQQAIKEAGTRDP